MDGEESRVRVVRPEDILIPQGYRIEVFADGLTTPISLAHNEEGELLIGDAGITSGSGKVLKWSSGGRELLAEGFNPPLTGITFHRGDIYVSHRGFITVLRKDGTRQDILSGLPSQGDHHNNQVVFGADGKMYFGQGTATNSGVVGKDNSRWVKEHPLLHDYPASIVQFSGHNFNTKDFLTGTSNDRTVTGAFSPFGVPSFPGEYIKGVIKASGSILRANPDGSDLEVVAWGLRNPFRLKFDQNGRLYCANHGMDVRGSRPVSNSPDEFQHIQKGMWYGWPDYTGGYPITNENFKPEGKAQPTFLFAQHPMYPPKPLANFAPHSAIMGFDFNYSPAFGPVGEGYIAEFGSEAPMTTGGKPAPYVGHRVSRIKPETGEVNVFAINKAGGAASATGDGGLERPIDVLFGPSNEMYIADFGINKTDMGFGSFYPNTGVIWKVTRL